MHAIFVAHGPFAKRLKDQRMRREGRSAKIDVIPGFPNVELYNLVTQTLLRLPKTAPNNGSDGFWEQYIAES